VSLFRRRAQHVPLSQTGDLPAQEEVDAIAEAFPVPAESKAFFDDLDLVEFIAVALVKSFITRYKSQGGAGIFEGMDRYRRLEERIGQSAVQAGSLRGFWGHLCRSLQVPGAVGSPDPALLRLLSVGSLVGQRVLSALAETPAPHVMMGRFWDEQERAADPDYASKAGVEEVSGETDVVSLSAGSLTESGDTITVEVPHYSANSLRHELVREPLMWHLFQALGLEFDQPLGTRTSLFYNGGDLKESGTASTFWKRKRARNAYPGLALLGGATDTFLLGESNLRVHTWLRCKENNRALQRVGLESDASAFDMIDRQTHTRHSGRLGGDGDDDNQMLYTFETIAPGAEIVARLGLTTYAQDLEVGALGAALQTFRELDMTLGGQPARGYGKIGFEVVKGEDLIDPVQGYEEYLDAHADELKDGIMDGTLCSGAEVIT